MSHSPGPWIVSTLDGITVGFLDGGPLLENFRAVAIVKNRIGATDANARLIAAAPQLLAACKTALQIIEDWIGHLDPNGTDLQDIRHAIAKAEGTQP